MSKPIRIVIGTEPRTEIARKVLEYSIKANTNHDVEFYKIIGDDYSDRGALGQGTGFSLMRFSIPEMFNYTGMAIYLDADMLVLRDIAEFWNITPIKGNIVWCKYKSGKAETSAMLIDCKAAKNKIKSAKEITEFLKYDKDRSKYKEVMTLGYLRPKPVEISKWFNVMDRGSDYRAEDFQNKNAKILHFTDVPKQPWFNPSHPHANIWSDWFKRAVKDGCISNKEISDACDKFDVSNTRRPNGLNPHWKT